MVLSILMIVSGVAMSSLLHQGGTMIGVGVVFLATTLWSRDREIIILHDDHFEMKVAPLAKRHLLEYEDIEDILHPSEKRAFIVSQGRRIRLPLHVLTSEDREALLERLTERCAMAKAS